MDRATFNRVLAWSPEDEDRAGGFDPYYRLNRPAPWPVIMTVQRLAFQRGEPFAFEVACALTRQRAAA